MDAVDEPTQERIAQLQPWVTGIEFGEICVGSRKII